MGLFTGHENNEIINKYVSILEESSINIMIKSSKVDEIINALNKMKRTYGNVDVSINGTKIVRISPGDFGIDLVSK